jgi:hypothetical protein
VRVFYYDDALNYQKNEELIFLGKSVVSTEIPENSLNSDGML